MTNTTVPTTVVGVPNESTSTEYGSYSIEELFPPVDAIKTQPIQMENLPLEQIPIQQPTIIINDDALRVYDHGVHRAQGARSHQEDRYVLLDQMNTNGFAFFGVYDGHHNELFSSHASKHLHNHILESVEFTNGNIHEAIRTGFYLEDKQTFDELVNRKRELLGGSTAAIALLMANQRELWVGNAGDSRVVLAQKSVQYGKAADDKTWYDAIRLSHDHKPTDPEEMERITSSGGSVTKGRVENAINMSRALGDHTFKYPLNHKRFNHNATDDFITVEPYIRNVTVNPQHHDFMMIASDGIQQLTDAQVINVIGQLWRDGHNAEEISKRIVECLAKNTQSDNITCIIVFFKPRPDPLQ